jgi:hypothetical protein
MKSIKEKELLVNFARSMGQDVDADLVEEVDRINAIRNSVRASISENVFKDLGAAVTSSKSKPKNAVSENSEPEEPQEVLVPEIKFPVPPSLDELFLVLNEQIEEAKNELVQKKAEIEGSTQITATSHESDNREIIEGNKEQSETSGDSGQQSSTQTLADVTAKFISESPKKDSYQQPDIPLTTSSMKAVQDKLKFLEQWLSKISMTGPGGGAVNLKDLDDVSKYSITNATENQYLTYNAQSKLWIATNHTNTNLYLNDLVDVVITAPTNGQVLKYDTVANAWVAAADISVTQNGAPVISFSDLTVATLSPTEGGALQYNSNTGVFSHAPSILDTLDSVTRRGNVTNNSIAVNSVSIPVGSLLSGSGNIIASILNERLDSVLEYGNTASLSIGDYGLTNGITGVPYVVYRLKTNPVIPLQVGDIVGGASIPSTSAILAVGTGANANIVITNTNFAANALIPLANTVLTFARAIINAGLSISTNANTDITLNPGVGGYIVPHSDIIPFTTNQWSLGTPAKRFKEIWLGTGTIYVEDEVLGNDQALGARNGNFYIDGGAGLEVGEFTFVDNQIKIKNNARDMIVGTIGATANVVFNRPLVVQTNTSRESFNVTRDGLVKILTPIPLLTTQSALEIIGGSKGISRPRNFNGTLLQLTAQDDSPCRVSMDSFANSAANSYAVIAARQARGTVSSPTSTQANDTIFRISTQGWGTTGYVPSIGRINIQATQNFTDSNAGTRVRFQLTPTNSNVIQTTSADIDSTGLSFVGNNDGGITFRDNTRQTTAFTPAAFGSFWDNTTQACGANTATRMIFGNTDGHSGVNLANANTRVVLSVPGVYNIQFSAQIASTDNAPDQTFIWFRQNGTDIADSASVVTVPAKHAGGDGAAIPAWNYFVTTANVNEYVEIMWFTLNETKVKLRADPAANLIVGVSPIIPRIPSTILTVNQIR